MTGARNQMTAIRNQIPDGDRHPGPGDLPAPKKATLIGHFTDLMVWQKAFQLGREIYTLTTTWPVKEQHSLTDQARRSARSVSTNVARAWSKRRCEAQFVAKLSEADTGLHETENWLLFAAAHGYLGKGELAALRVRLHEVSRMLGSMTAHSALFVLKAPADGSELPPRPPAP